MASVGIIVPFFGKPEETQKRFFEWLEKNETVEKFRELGVGKENIFSECGRPGEILDKQGLVLLDRVPKGIYIQRATSELKRVSQPDYYVCIDGEGIPYDYIFPLLEQLIIQPVFGAIACRKNILNLGDENREIVEKFELYIVAKIFGTPLFDGQCGCWGFRKEFLDERKLEGEDFEIELDFLIKLLTLGREIAVVPVETNRAPNDVPTFKPPDHKTKMVFLCNILQRGKEEIIGFVTAFEKEICQLPSSYKKEIENVGYTPFKVGIICTGTCDSCPYKST